MEGLRPAVLATGVPVLVRTAAGGWRLSLDEGGVDSYGLRRSMMGLIRLRKLPRSSSGCKRWRMRVPIC
jgi:hypothetical protein